ncbi:hypothetical protein G6L09_11595 [Agrobacterium rhizogenes]|nr:hypothetical protein [Rhizobium rhizogenes]
MACPYMPIHIGANCFTKCTEIRFEFEASMDSDSKGVKIFEGLNEVRRLKLIDRFIVQLRSASKTMAANGRLDFVEMLDEVVNDLTANAHEIASTMIGIEILVHAAGLLEMAKVLASGSDEPVTLH